MDYFVKKCLRGLCAALLPVLLLASCSVQEPDASSAVTASALAEANASSSALAARTAGASSDRTAQTAHTAQNARTASAATAQTGNSTQSVPPSASAANGTAPSYATLSPELTVSAQNSQTAKTPAPVPTPTPTPAPTRTLPPSPQQTEAQGEYGLDITDKNDLVSICYSTWFNPIVAKSGSASGIYNITEILAGNGQWGPENAFHFWGEPAVGYYRSDDKSVIRTHMTQLAEAGVDFIIIDNTNAQANTWGAGRCRQLLGFDGFAVMYGPAGYHSYYAL